jgi:hypothetical protein
MRGTVRRDDARQSHETMMRGAMGCSLAMHVLWCSCDACKALLSLRHLHQDGPPRADQVGVLGSNRGNRFPPPRADQVLP